MLAAYNYPLLDIFWSMLFFFLFFLWIWLLVTVFIDIFRSPDLHGFHKAAWFIFILLIPLLGVLVYLIARGHKMAEHAAQQAADQQAAFKDYVQDVTGGGAADQLSKLADLRAQGVITAEEFDQQKAKLLA
jgi:hypothetical protein